MDTLVGRMLQRANRSLAGYHELLADDEKILSANKVTGVSLNFPIAGTCEPTKVCAQTCYFAKGASTWPAALKKQRRLYYSVKDDPAGMAARLVREVEGKRSPPSFIRWNGGGDLFPESVAMLDLVAQALPDTPFWVTTRLPLQAASVTPQPNVYIHFSLDRGSLERRAKFERQAPEGLRYFFSYQCAPGEIPSAEQLAGVSVVFFDGYEPPDVGVALDRETLCPLNLATDIRDTCATCRRCFDGSAVAHRVLRS